MSCSKVTVQMSLPSPLEVRPWTESTELGMPDSSTMLMKTSSNQNVAPVIYFDANRKTTIAPDIEPNTVERVL